MNWYLKYSGYNPPFTILSYNHSWELVVMFNNGKRYVYPGVSPSIYEKIEKLLSRKNSSAAIKILQNIANNNKKQQSHTTEEKEEMVNELYERGIL